MEATDEPQLGQELYDRLVCAKYIFIRGTETLNSGNHFAGGLAILAFQDAAEMVLRVVAERLDLQVKENCAFDRLITLINEAENGQVTQRSALNQLNKARVNFKHFGQIPRLEDACKFRQDLEGFFLQTTKSFLGLDFESLSLTDLIHDKETADAIRQAEQALEEQHYETSLELVAKAFEKARLKFRLETRKTSLRSFVRSPSQAIRGQAADEGLVTLAKETDRRLEEIERQLDIAADGTRLDDYRRFRHLTPHVSLATDGDPIVPLLTFEWVVVG